MRFAFTDDQLELAAAVRSLLEKECPPEGVRAAWEGDGRVPGLWPRLAELGLLGLLVPGDHGGLGATPVDAILPLFECGRAGVADPVVETAFVAPPVFAAAGRGEVLERVAAGELTVAAAPASAPLFPHGDTAGALLLLTEGEGARAPSVSLLEPPASTGVPAAAPPEAPFPGALLARSVDPSRRLVRAPAELPGAWAVLHVNPDEAARAFDRAAVGTAAFLLGLAERMLDITVAYVKERHQFGAPIGSFQAVKHHCADALLAIELAKPVVWRAAWSLAHAGGSGSDQPPLVATHASMAKCQASEAAQRVSTLSLQCHAAIGYTVEYDLHLFMKRAWALARAWGDPAFHRRRIRATMLTPHSASRSTREEP